MSVPPTTAMRTKRPSLVSVSPRTRTWPYLAGHVRVRGRSEVLAGGDPLDVPAAGGPAVLPVDDRADVDDALALLARDLRPVVRVGRGGQVLVLLVLMVVGVAEVGQSVVHSAPVA